MMNLANFSNLFPFKSNSPAASPINLLLDTQNVAIQRLLDQQTFVNEFKMQNPKLVQYMKYDKYKQLIEFITIVGPEQDNKRGYKYPFVACQALSTDINAPAEFFLPQKQMFVDQEIVEEKEFQQQVQEIIQSPQKKQNQDIQNKAENSENPNESINNVQEQKVKSAQKQTRKVKKIVKKSVTKKIKKAVPPLINALFKYIQGDVNYTLAGYFSRVLTILFNKKSISLTNYFFTSKQYIKMIDHIQSRSIAELIIRFATIDSLQFIVQRQQLLDLILLRLSKSTEINLMGNLSFVLCDIIQKYSSTIKTVNGSKQLLIYIYSLSFCERLVSNVLSDENDAISAYNTPILLSSLTSIRSIIQNKQQSKNSDLTQKFQEITHFIKNNLAQSIQLNTLFKNFIYKALQKLNITRRQSQTFGFGRTKLVEVLFYLIKFDFFNLQAVLPETKFFQRLLNLMKEYELNNVLHNQIIKILSFVFELQQGSPIISNLLQKGKIINFIYNEVLEDKKILENIKNKKRVFRKGYIGHIVKIGQLILKASGMNNQITLLFSDQKWVTIKQFINKQTYENQRNLAGFSTKKFDGTNLQFSKQDILALHHTFLNQTPYTTYPEPIQQFEEDQIQKTMMEFQKLQIIQQKKQKQKQNAQVAKSEIKQETKPTVHAQHQHHQHPVVVHDKQKQQIAHKVEQQNQKQIQQGLEIYSDVKYWKDSKKLQFEVDDLIAEL